MFTYREDSKAKLEIGGDYYLVVFAVTEHRDAEFKLREGSAVDAGKDIFRGEWMGFDMANVSIVEDSAFFAVQIVAAVDDE